MNENVALINGDCLEILKELPDNSLDSLVTDPPAGISFMGKDWDGDKGGRKQWCAWMTSVMQECLRVLKPGAHGLVWAIPRTSHWTATALEDAGFEIRDVVTHLFGSGFPKSLNVEKAGAGNEWQGWGTALKPAAEFWILVRKPCSEKTVAKNVLQWGTGALNLDASRVGTQVLPEATAGQSRIGTFERTNMVTPERIGRFPANLVLSHSEHCADDQCDIECAIKALDGQGWPSWSNGVGPSRFFYCAKISSSERNAGLDGMPKGPAPASARSKAAPGRSLPLGEARANHHPTVKPKKLMGYLIRMITPPGGIVLDPFMGSGSTGVAALEGRFQFIGIEQSVEYFAICEQRVNSTPIEVA